jgi:activator of 2-hydroxyglutaryl-CoA dehydratase
MDWNTSCASSTGATVEMLMKFYNVKSDDLKFQEEKFAVTCGIFGMEKIMDSISGGSKPAEAVSKFVHGIAFNAWNFSKRPEKIYLSGGFCENKCFTESLSRYCEVVTLGRFVLCEGLF